MNVEKNKKNGWKRILIFTLMFFLSGGIAYLGCLLYQNKPDMLLRNTVMILSGTGVVIFSFVLSLSLIHISEPTRLL